MFHIRAEGTLVSAVNAYIQEGWGQAVELILHGSPNLLLQMEMKIGTFGSVLRS